MKSTLAGLRFLLVLVAAAWVLPAGADEIEETQEAEEARRLTFRLGMETIVADLNTEWYDSFVNSINREAMYERIFGLRLIDQRIKKSFLESMERSWGDFIISRFPDDEGGLKATLLGVESRGNRGRAVVRFDLPKFKFAYHEYDLMLDGQGRLFILDWKDYLQGATFSEDVGQWLVQGSPSQPAMRKLLDFRNPTESELFQFRELLKAARDNQLPRYLEILEGLPEKYQRQRIVVENTVHLAQRLRKRRQMLAGLETMANYYPDEPLYSLMLLEHYFPRKQYEEAQRALLRVYDKLGFPDAAMEARLSATALVMGNPQDALGHANRALELEPGLELGWWSALNARATLEDYAGATKALDVLEGQFDHELTPEALGRDPTYRGLLGSAEYRDWLESR